MNLLQQYEKRSRETIENILDISPALRLRFRQINASIIIALYKSFKNGEINALQYQNTVHKFMSDIRDFCQKDVALLRITDTKDFIIKVDNKIESIVSFLSRELPLS